MHKMHHTRFSAGVMQVKSVLVSRVWVTNVSCVQISAQDVAEGNGFLQLKQAEMHGNLRGRDCGREVLTVILQNAGSAGFPQRFPDAARLRGSAGNENSG